MLFVGRVVEQHLVPRVPRWRLGGKRKDKGESSSIEMERLSIVTVPSLKILSGSMWCSMNGDELHSSSFIVSVSSFQNRGNDQHVHTASQRGWLQWMSLDCLVYHEFHWRLCWNDVKNRDLVKKQMKKRNRGAGLERCQLGLGFFFLHKTMSFWV